MSKKMCNNRKGKGRQKIGKPPSKYFRRTQIGWVIWLSSTPVLVLFLSGVPPRASSQERKRHININIFGRWPLWWPGSLPTRRPGVKYFCCATFTTQGTWIFLLGVPGRENRWPGRPEKVTYQRGQNHYKKTLFTKIIRDNSFCNYYKALCIQLDSSRKGSHKRIANRIVSGNEIL